MFRAIRHPSPATIIALLALFIAMSGTAVAAGVVPLAKRALVADNAKALQGKTVTQLLAHERQPAKKALESDRIDGMHAQDVAALPSPASTAAGMVNVKTGTWSVSPRDYRPFTVRRGPEGDLRWLDGSSRLGRRVRVVSDTHVRRVDDLDLGLGRSAWRTVRHGLRNLPQVGIGSELC
jgi:hypothetical protein